MTGFITPDWGQLLDAWCKDLETDGRAASTIDGYRRHLDRLATDMMDRSPWSLTGHQLAEWVTGHHWSRYTVNRVTSSLRSFYRWGIVQGYTRRSPLPSLTVDLHRPPGPTRARLPEAWKAPTEDFLGWLTAGGRAASTIEHHRLVLSNLAANYADPADISMRDLVEWIGRADLAPETRRSRRSVTRQFYRWGVRTGRFDTDPTEDLATVRCPRALPRPISDDALGQALRACDDRERLMLMCAALGGLRRAEVARLSFGDMDGENFLIRGKGGRDRLVPIHPDLAVALTAERRRREQGLQGTGWGPLCSSHSWVFPNSDNSGPLMPASVGVIVSRVLPAGWTMHQLRHRFATTAYQAQRDLRAVQELLGHSKPETTARYAAVPDGARQRAVAAVGLPM